MSGCGCWPRPAPSSRVRSGPVLRHHVLYGQDDLPGACQRPGVRPGLPAHGPGGPVVALREGSHVKPGAPGVALALAGSVPGVGFGGRPPASAVHDPVGVVPVHPCAGDLPDIGVGVDWADDFRVGVGPLVAGFLRALGHPAVLYSNQVGGDTAGRAVTARCECLQPQAQPRPAKPGLTLSW